VSGLVGVGGGDAWRSAYKYIPMEADFVSNYSYTVMYLLLLGFTKSPFPSRAKTFF